MVKVVFMLKRKIKIFQLMWFFNNKDLIMFVNVCCE